MFILMDHEKRIGRGSKNNNLSYYLQNCRECFKYSCRANCYQKTFHTFFCAGSEVKSFIDFKWGNIELSIKLPRQQEAVVTFNFE